MKYSMKMFLAAAAGTALMACGTSATATPTTATTTTVDTVTEDALVHMVEEEKLAHDVYVTLAAGSDLQMFDRISDAEARHESELQALLDRYDLADPTAGNDIGEFTDPAFGTLFDQLVAEGGASDAAAMQVGVTIEQMDIADLQDRLAATMPSDVAQAFERLLAGSERHLAAFQR